MTLKALLFGSVLLAVATPQVAAAQTMEDRLRTQLRQSVEELRALQAQQASWQAEKAALEAKVNQAKASSGDSKQSAAQRAELASLRAELEKARQAANATAGDTAKLQADLAQANEKGRAAIAEINRLTAERQQIVSAAKEIEGTLAICQTKNQSLYKTGKDILTAYENVGFGKVLLGREPFIQAKRVALENEAQAFGDKLYDATFDPRVDRPVTEPAPAQDAPQQPQ